MKKVLLITIIIVASSLVLANYMFAVEKGKTEVPNAAALSAAQSATAAVPAMTPEEEAKKAAEEAARKAAEEKARLEEQKRVEEELAKRQIDEGTAIKELTTKAWFIALWPVDKPEGDLRIDKITFAERKITSKMLSEQGYPTSNATLSIQKNGTIVWETMQRNKNDDSAFWRGNLLPDKTTMRGMLLLQPKKGKVEQYSFNTASPEQVASLEANQTAQQEDKKEVKEKIKKR